MTVVLKPAGKMLEKQVIEDWRRRLAAASLSG